MNKKPKYILVESSVLPDIYLKVIDAKRYLSTGRARSVNEAAKMAGLSRSAFYKYKDSVHPFTEKTGGHMITINALLRDEPGVLANLIAYLYRGGANILTINQNIPVDGVAPVSVTAQIDDLCIPLDEILSGLRDADGVRNIDVVSGM